MKHVTISFRGVDEIVVTATQKLRSMLRSKGLWKKTYRYHAFRRSSLEDVVQTGRVGDSNEVDCCSITGDEIRDNHEYDLLHYLMQYEEADAAYFAIYSMEFIDEIAHPSYQFRNANDALIAIVEIKNFNG